MDLAWKCTCGDTFGPSESLKLNRHIKHGKDRQEEHAMVGLVDKETGEVKTKSVSWATHIGLIPHSKRWHKKHPPPPETPPGDTKPPDDTSLETAEDRVATTVRGRFVTKEILLDGRLLVLYDLVRNTIPEYQADEAKWIWDCVTGYYSEHPEFGLGRLFPEFFSKPETPAEVAHAA